VTGVRGGIRVVLVAVAIGLATPGVATAGRSGQCECIDNDADTAVSLGITASSPTEHSRIGPDRQTAVLDLRGTSTTATGEIPTLLADVDLDEVPVLVAVAGPEETDPCTIASPPAGANLSLTGRAYIDDGAPVVWTGPCQGELTVVDAPAAAEESETEADADLWAPELRLAAMVLAGGAAVCLALAAIVGHRREQP
jgi:hypothetical protein